MYEKVQFLADACRNLEFAKTKLYEVGFEDIAKKIEEIQNDIYRRIGFLRERDKKEELREIAKTIKEIEKQERFNNNDSSPNVTWITENIGYYYDINERKYVLVRNRPYGPVTIKTFDLSDLHRLNEKLPDKATVNDLIRVAEEIGLKVRGHAQYLMRILANEVRFNRELRVQGRLLVLARVEEYSLADEVRKQLLVEKDVVR